MNPLEEHLREQTTVVQSPDPNMESAALKGFQAARETALADRVEDDVVDP
jgi:hypothetical protein